MSGGGGVLAYRNVGTEAPLPSVGLTKAIFGAKSIGNILFGLLFMMATPWRSRSLNPYPRREAQFQILSSEATISWWTCLLLHGSDSYREVDEKCSICILYLLQCCYNGIGQQRFGVHGKRRESTVDWRRYSLMKSHLC